MPIRNEILVGIAAYADYITRLTPSKHQQVLNLLESYCALYDIKTNVNKTKRICINGTGNLPINFWLNNQK